MGQEILPFLLDVPEAQLADLRRRLRATRWPEPEPVPDWSQGVPLAYLRDLCEYWAQGYDWRPAEARLNEPTLAGSVPTMVGTTAVGLRCEGRQAERVV